MYEFCFQGRERKCWTAWSPGYPGRTGELPQVLTHEIIKTLGWETLQDRRTKLRLTTRFYSNKTFKVPLIFIQPGFNMSIWTLFLQSHHFKGYYHHSPKTILKWNQFHHYITLHPATRYSRRHRHPKTGNVYFNCPPNIKLLRTLTLGRQPDG